MKGIRERIIDIRNSIETLKKEKSIERDIKIIAVSKTFPSDAIKEAYESGIKDIGENRYQEALKKIEELKELDINWHFIGTLQTNKIRKIMEKFSIIQSVSKIKHIDKIDEIAAEKGISYPFLIEINIGEEKSKSGFLNEQIDEVLDIISNKNNIILKGFMAIPPYSPEPENSRKYFIEMREIFERYRAFVSDNVSIEELSMGMSEDYLIAIEEGATMVRIGRGIFGERSYK